MKLLALDPSATCTGYVFYDTDATPQVAIAGFIDELRGDTDGARYKVAYDAVVGLIQRFAPTTIIMEGYFFSKRFATGTNIGPELRGVLKMAAHTFGVPVYISDPAGWKRQILHAVIEQKINPPYHRLKSNDSKIARWKKLLKKQYGKDKAKKIIVVEALEMLGYKLPTKIINKATGRKIAFRFDVSDAIGILIAFLGEQAEKVPSTFTWEFEVVT